MSYTRNACVTTWHDNIIQAVVDGQSRFTTFHACISNWQRTALQSNCHRFAKCRRTVNDIGRIDVTYGWHQHASSATCMCHVHVANRCMTMNDDIALFNDDVTHGKKCVVLRREYTYGVCMRGRTGKAAASIVQCQSDWVSPGSIPIGQEISIRASNVVDNNAYQLL